MTRAMRTIIAFNFTFIALFGGIAIFTLIFPKVTHASCNGTVTCGRQVVQVCQDAGGATCSYGDLGCTCVDDCRLAESGSCSPAAVAQCDAASVCSIYVAVCHISGSCSWSSPPPPPPATCPNGACGAGESCLSCPSDCGACPGTCSVACFGGIANCGAVNRVAGVGTCSAGELCCGDIASGGCSPRTCSLNNLTVEQYRYALNFFQARVSGIADGFTGQPGQWTPPANATLTPAYNETALWWASVYAHTAGTYPYSFRYLGSTAGECPCTATANLTVLPTALASTTIIPAPNPIVVGEGETVVFNAQITHTLPTTYVNYISAISVGAGARATIASTHPTNPIFPTTTDNENYQTNVTGVQASTDSALRLYLVSADPWKEFVVNVPIIVTAAPVNQPPTVTINNPTNGSTVILGSTVTITASAVDPEGDAVTQVEFQVDGAAFPPSSTDIAGPPWSADWTPSTTGAHTIRCRATDSNGNVGAWTSVNVNTIDPNPWFQVAGGNIVSRATISSPVPLTLGQPFIIDDIISGAPGVAIFRGSLNINSATLSSTNWKTDTNTLANIYNYAYFANLAEGKTFKELPANTTLSTNDFASAALDGGYAWIRVNGDASLGGVGGPDFFNVNKRAIVFVNGDLTINDKANLNAGVGNNFLMLIVRDDIIVNPDLSSTDATDPALHGVFFAGGSFNSGTNGTDDERLVVRGTVAATNINLERDLNVENIITPAEMFIFSPELVVNYPPALSVKHLNWREVAP